MTKQLNHKLDVSKIETLEDVRNVFKGMNLIAIAGEDNPDYELLKEYFTIPNIVKPLLIMPETTETYD